jgi:nucleotide-binding universal stress UspA family protein
MYKTILVHVDGTTGSAQRVTIASRLANLYDAHLVGTAMTGLSAYMFPVTALGAGMPPITFPVEELRAEADRVLDGFDSGARQAGVKSVERRRVDDEAAAGLSLQARYCDLVVVSQTCADEVFPHLPSDFPESVLLNCARPVLVVPAAGIKAALGRRVTVAWNGSANAVRAITSAIPLLQRAEQVFLVVCNAEAERDLHGEEAGADMALYLARHGVKVEVSTVSSPEDNGAALLTFAADKESDLIVMGAYGHSRLREIVLGGATRTALSLSSIPLWMAH